MDFNSSIEGMIYAQKQMDLSAQRIIHNSFGDSRQDITKEILQNKKAKFNFAANIRAAKVQDKLLGETIDLLG